VYLQAAFGVSAALARLAGLAQESVRRNMQRLFALLLASRRNEAGLVLTVDNAQWLDRPTADLLNALLDDAAGALTVVLLSDGSETHGEAPRKADLELTLGPLTERERGLLFDSLTPALDHLPELRQWVIFRSVGTPDFLEELARLVRRVMDENAGHITADHVADIVEVVPVSQEEIVRRRVERLDERTRQVLEAAAVLGPACSLGLLECFDQIRDGLEERLSFLV
jgi:predicted ATPase